MKEKDIGAIWNKESFKGEDYQFGYLKISKSEIKELYNKSENDVKIPFIIFKNGFKEKDNHPDFRIYKERERDQYKKVEDLI